ncbi:hypothetical protein JYG23_04245 [Sedimentibacter sp. zth1]|uniref:hypothetical protein n=1 Tax=Sedimentibacter sp. zth1 TaxID=2816908 RepID=UPI001A9265D2|nr:hypothetical protein [Sedimentibacter sp. zth1]QSX06672.1 hypothetical protein JYG23_04245 [Sedimentibacter sp. zth1]
MKYMTFNNSCSFAGVANMLEDFSIDIEDYQLAIEMKVPFIFKFDERWKRYLSGSMLQEDKYFNYYLQKWNLKLIENKVSKEDVLSFFNTLKQKAMIGLNISEGYKHAVIYFGNENNEYIFLNNRRKDANEPKYYKYGSDELKEKIDGTAIISYIDKHIENFELDIKKEINNSVIYLERYRKEVEDFCQKEQSVNSLQYAMNTYFRALFLDVYSMMKILEEVKIVKQISEVRSEYLQAIKINKSLRLSDFISLDELNKIIDQYKELIQLQILK